MEEEQAAYYEEMEFGSEHQAQKDFVERGESLNPQKFNQWYAALEKFKARGYRPTVNPDLPQDGAQEEMSIDELLAPSTLPPALVRSEAKHVDADIDELLRPLTAFEPATGSTAVVEVKQPVPLSGGAVVVALDAADDDTGMESVMTKAAVRVVPKVRVNAVEHTDPGKCATKELFETFVLTEDDSVASDPRVIAAYQS